MRVSSPNRSQVKQSGQIRAAWTSYLRGEIDSARRLLGELSELESSDPRVALQRGLIELREGNPAGALPFLERSAQKAPKNPAPLFFLLLTRLELDQMELAAQEFEKLKSLCPRHQGLPSLELLRTLRRGDPLPVLRRLGFAKADSSLAGWKSLAAGLGVGDPNWLPAELTSSSYLLGPILVETEQRLLPLEIPALERRFRPLEQELEEAPQAKRDLRQEFRNLGRSMRGGALLRRGKKSLENALGGSDIEEQRSAFRRAQALLRLSRKLDPSAFRVSFYLGEAYLFSARNYNGKPYLRQPLLRAESAFLESARRDGKNPYLLFYLALTQHLLGRPEEALIFYRKATEKFAKLPEAYYGMGQCYLFLGRRAEAQKEFLRAISSDLSLAKERLVALADLLEKGAELPDPESMPILPPRPLTELTSQTSAEGLPETGEAGEAEDQPPDEEPVVTDASADNVDRVEPIEHDSAPQPQPPPAP